MRCPCGTSRTVAVATKSFLSDNSLSQNLVWPPTNGVLCPILSYLCQLLSSDCGATCLASVAAYYGLKFPISRIHQYALTDKKGTNIDEQGASLSGGERQRDEISDEAAAVLLIADFTSYSMVRQVVKSKAKVLVTASKSNTSLATISVLRNYDVEVYAMTSSLKYADVLKEMGVIDILPVNLELDSFLDDPNLSEIMKKLALLMP